jgi:hypothetical protein
VIQQPLQESSPAQSAVVEAQQLTPASAVQQVAEERNLLVQTLTENVSVHPLD